MIYRSQFVARIANAIQTANFANSGFMCLVTKRCAMLQWLPISDPGLFAPDDVVIEIEGGREMKAALVVMFVLGVAWACSGCALVAAGVVGGVIVHNCEVSRRLLPDAPSASSLSPMLELREPSVDGCKQGQDYYAGCLASQLGGQNGYQQHGL